MATPTGPALGMRCRGTEPCLQSDVSRQWRLARSCQPVNGTGAAHGKKTSQAQHGLDMLVDVGCILVAHNL